MGGLFLATGLLIKRGLLRQHPGCLVEAIQVMLVSGRQVEGY
jgi:hypothetical protein